METNKYLDGIEELVDSYGFPASADKVEKHNLIFNLNIHLKAFKKERGDGHPLPTIYSYSTFEEFKRFIHFLAICKGSEITMTGKITSPKNKEEIKDNPAAYKFSDWEFLSLLQAIADFEMGSYERFVCQNPITIEISKLKGNRLLGLYASSLLGIINEFDLGGASDRKKYNFIYDALLMVGITGKKAIPDSAEKVTEKYQAVRNWIIAYEKQKQSKC